MRSNPFVGTHATRQLSGFGGCALLHACGLAIIGTAVSGCSHPSRASMQRAAVKPAATTPWNPASWVGVYSSPAESGGFSGTALVLRDDLRGGLDYRMSFYTDVRDVSEIVEKEKFGGVLTDGDRLYVPEASGYRRGDEISTIANVERYTRATINGRTVLLRDDALKAYREQDRLYDYGILIKVADLAQPLQDLSTVKHESIKVLYRDPSKPWKDPFVSGPNSR